MLSSFRIRESFGLQGARLKYFNASALNPSDVPEQSPLYQFNKYWNSLKSEIGLPRRKDLDPTEIPRIVSWLFLADVVGTERNKLEFVYRLIGTSNANLVGKDATGKRVTDAFDQSAARVIVAHYTKTVDTRQPTFWKTEVPTQQRRFIRCFRGVFPLSNDGARVDMLAGMLVPVTEVVRF